MDTLPREIQYKIMLLVRAPQCLVKVCKVWKAVIEGNISLFIHGISNVTPLPSTWYPHLSVQQKISLVNHTQWHDENLLSRLDKKHLILWSEVIEYIAANPSQISELLYIGAKYCIFTGVSVYFGNAFTIYEPYRRHILSEISATDRDEIIKKCDEAKEWNRVGMMSAVIWNYINDSYVAIHAKVHAEYQKMRKIHDVIRP